MDSELKWLIRIIGGIILFFVILFNITADYSTMEAQVKVQEVGTRYQWLNFGEQNYIRVQNAYSEQYSASSESWETCIDSRDITKFKEIKDNKWTVNIVVKGHGLSNTFTCKTGDRVIEIKQ